MKMRSAPSSPRVFVLDIDGVLTDGTVGNAPGGGRRLHLRDLDAIARARQAGIQVAFLTGEDESEVSWIVARCGGGPVVYNAKDKEHGLRELVGRMGVDVGDVCYVGDARRDVEALKLAGLGLAPADADVMARCAASRVLASPGGRGAVAEAADILMGERNSGSAAPTPRESDSPNG
jgi:3-deoxy-D-manno-octulosonate 8-phosphate phosphatase (KDO 8-P phosphatase)